MNDQPKKSGLPTKRFLFLSGSLGLFVLFGILQYSLLQLGCGLMVLAAIMTKKRTPKENPEPTSSELPSFKKKISYVLGMMIFLILAFMMGGLGYGEITEPVNNLIGFAVYGLISLSLGFAAVLFGYRVWAPVTRQGWIKNKLKNTAVLSFLCAMLVVINLPHQNQYRSYRFNSQAKHDLHNMFVACQTYWKKKGDDKVCDQKIASQGEFGFVSSKYVSISGKGKVANFTATAQHKKSSTVFTIDAEGKITQAWSQ